MSNYLDDFDLDLRRTAEQGNAKSIENSFSSSTSLTTFVCSLTGELSEYSVEHCGDPSGGVTPTTGMTVGCCNRDGNVTPDCV